MCLQKDEIVPKALANDNWYGYTERWIYENNVTWMERTCATPYWTGLMLIEIDIRRGGKGGRKKHLMHAPLYQNEGRVQFKGQLFSAPMDWNSITEQLQRMEKQETLISLPVSGAVLAQRVKLAITAGLTDLNKCIQQATIRRNVVVQLIRMQRDAGHPDYQQQDLAKVALRAKMMTPTDDPSIPAGILELLDEKDEDAPYLGVDKAATPAERLHSEAQLEREMNRARPQILVAQRDSDANKDVEASRLNAFSEFSTLALQTGSTLIDQFKTAYFRGCSTSRCRGASEAPTFQNKRGTDARSPTPPPFILLLGRQ